MRFPQSYVVKGATGTVQAVTGAAPQTVAGATLDSGLASITIGAMVYAKATTASLTLAAKWQVLANDGVTWVDVVESNNPANVVLITASGNVTKMVSAPLAVTSGSRPCRCVVVSAAATGAGLGTDECSISYDYRAPVNIYGS